MKTKIIRSSKRKRTISAKIVDGVFEVRVPEKISETDLEPIIENLKKRWEKRQAKSKLDDKALQRRAETLNRQYFDGKLKWKSIRWVTNQNNRFGSCTPANGTIRLSHRLATMPAFVQNYVIVHELAHLIENNHSPQFWKLVNRYPKTERARGYLMAVGLENLED